MLTIITGPMFSGKTSKLISIAKANLIAGNKIGVYKPSNDDRYCVEGIATHDGREIPAVMLDRHNPDKLWFNGFYATRYNPDAVLFFDECQFFNTNKFEWLIRKLLDRNVVCAGLANDFQGFPFGPMPYLLSVADQIISLKAVCAKCKKIGTATRTFRKTKDQRQTVVGGAEMYEPRCFDCWKEETELHGTGDRD